MFINLKEIVLKINDYVIKTKANINNNKISFQDLTVNYVYDFDNNILTRENDEFCLVLDFNNKKYSYLLKDINKSICDDIIINNLQIVQNKVIIIYQIADCVFNLSIEIKEES